MFWFRCQGSQDRLKSTCSSARTLSKFTQIFPLVLHAQPFVRAIGWVEFVHCVHWIFFLISEAPRPAKAQPESFGHLYKDDAAIFNTLVHSGKQFRHFKYAAVNLLVTLFTNSDFISRVSIYRIWHELSFSINIYPPCDTFVVGFWHAMSSKWWTSRNIEVLIEETSVLYVGKEWISIVTN